MKDQQGAVTAGTFAGISVGSFSYVHLNFRPQEEVPTCPLTDTSIRNAKPTAKAQKLSDGEGLYLHISPTGGKLWRMAYRFGGKQKTLSLGQ